jgi:acyl carrier protein
MDHYLEPIIAIICEVTGMPDDNLDDDSHLLDDCCIDSLQIFEILTAIEYEFEMEIMEEDWQKWQTIGCVCEYLYYHLGEPVDPSY